VTQNIKQEELALVS